MATVATRSGAEPGDHRVEVLAGAASPKGRRAVGRSPGQKEEV